MKILFKYRIGARKGPFRLNYQILIFLGLMMILLSSCYKLKVEVTRLPENTPANDPIYISGNFNNWDPGDDRYRLRLRADSVYVVDLPSGIGKIEYKFTRGDWTTVEKDACGFETDNRTADYGKESIIRDTIQSWNDLPKINCPHVTLVINHLPDNTPAGSIFSLAGTMNNWDPGQENFEFHYDSTLRKPVLNLPRLGDNRTVEFKITRGSLVRVESDEFGNEIPARSLTFGDADTVFLNIKGWEDLSKLNSNLLTIIVTSIPANTPSGDGIYLTGNINNWYPRQANFRLEKNNKGEYFIKIPKIGKELKYKFTRGIWSTVEVDKYGYNINDRILNYMNQDTAYVKIANWIDLSRKQDVPVHIIVESIPENTPRGDDLYIAGNFNGWDPGSRRWMLKKDNDGTYSIDIPRSEGTLEFKITRGNWQTVECKASGEEMPNRSYQYKDIDVLKIKVMKWVDRP